MRLFAVVNMYYNTYTCYLANPNMASVSDENAVYLIESVVGGLHICKRVQSPTVCEGLQLSREDRNDDHFTACHQV